MLTFVRNKKGRAEAKEGCHDDLVMGLAISYDIREQQRFTLYPKVEKTIPNDYRTFGFTERRQIKDDDYGSRIEII